jgi:ABC-type nitrate/sulfonate/bicarbonate transport system substrate-binding protein
MPKKQQRLANAPASGLAAGRDAVRLGYVPLVDSAPLIAALELGFFAREGIRVKLLRQIGWAGVREGLIFDELDAAHALAPMAYTLKLGLGCAQTDVLVPYIISREGNAITLSVTLWKKGGRDPVSLRNLIRSERPRRLTFAVVAEASSHRILLQKWLKSGGIDLKHDLKVVVLPPEQMVRSLRAGLIDGFCAGEPWNTLAVQEGLGWCPVTSADLNPDHPEKVLLVRGDFAIHHKEQLQGIIRALAAAAAVCEDPEGREELVSLLAHRRYLNLPEKVISASLVGGFTRLPGADPHLRPMHRFRGSQVNTPTSDTGRWLFREMQDSGLLPEDMETPEHLPAAVFRGDIYNVALQKRSIPNPIPL